MFRESLLEQRFLPGGRIQAAMGSVKRVTPYNCFVSGTIEDSFVDGKGSIMQRATDAATTMRMGGGIGYDFSTLRPAGASITKLQSQSSGPVSFMQVFDAICKTIASSGHRRGAQMGVMRIDHPDIEEFIRAKQNDDNLTAFNMSVAVTDEFMDCLLLGREFPLKFEGKVYRYIDPKALWETLMRSTWDWAEPGVIFIDRINTMNNLHYCETIVATNPCGEQPLPPNGACLLGSFNLTKYVREEWYDGPQIGFAWEQLEEDIYHVVRAMDNVIDRAIYPMYEQEKEAKSKRRMGLGVTGVANAIERLGYTYGSEGFLMFFDEVMAKVKEHCYFASIALAKEKGPFPLFNKHEYLQGGFIKGLCLDIHAGIVDHGIRNSHLISIAPTGTISMAADNVSSGIEPVFAYSSQRIVQYPDGPSIETVLDYGYDKWGLEGKVSADVTIDEHLAVLEVAQRHTDSAVSKTCNVPPDMPWEEFKDTYVKAWKMGAKGITTYNTGGKRGAVIVADDEPAASCYVDPVTGRQECE